tara:strand:+ start:38 stop:1081 length:1044 start_codon:yes stop_codon:yes gene_type:complete
MKIIICFISFTTLIIISSTCYSNNLFESKYNKIEFKSKDIQNTKNNKFQELKITNLKKILKNILTSEGYKKIRNKIDGNFTDKLVKNILIEDELILESMYSANVKVNYDQDLILQFLRNNKLSFIDYLPNYFFTIILDKKDIHNNLFSEENDYYYYLLNTNNSKLKNFYKLPNLDINDKFLIKPINIINKDLESINKLLSKYNYSNSILIISNLISGKVEIEVYIIQDYKIFFVENVITEKLNFESFFTNLQPKIIDVWKIHNSIQNENIKNIKCYFNSLTIYELKEIISIIKSISVVSDYELKEIKLNKNLYEINYYGNFNILKRIFNMNLIDININNDHCEIRLK